MEDSQTYRLAMPFVELGRRDDRIAVCGDIDIAHVIDKDDDDIGFGR